MDTSSPSSAISVQSPWLNWWYRLTTPPELAVTTPASRERSTHVRLLSVVGLLLLVVIVVLLPATFFIPNPHTLQLCLAMMALCAICLGFNRAGKTRIACGLLVSSLELAIGLVIWTTRPFDVFNLPLFDIFIIAELLTVSLLPASSVFVVLLINAAFVAICLRFQVHTTQLEAILRTQYYNSLVRPVAVQLVVTVVSFVWVKLMAQATSRADQAEVILRLEQEVRFAAQAEAEQKALLEADIRVLIAMHNEAARGNLAVTASPAYDLRISTLSPLRTAFFLLYGRLRKAYSIEQKYQVLLQAIEQETQFIRSRGMITPTHTDLDTLLFALQQTNSKKC